MFLKVHTHCNFKIYNIKAPKISHRYIKLQLQRQAYQSSWRILETRVFKRKELTLSKVENNLFWYFSFFFFFKGFMFLFISTQRGREGEREGEKHQCVVASHMPMLGTWPETQACALTGNWTGESLVRCHPRLTYWATPARKQCILSWRANWRHNHCMLIPWQLKNYNLV